MRIVGGSVKGTRIKTLDNNRIRPTLDKVREALFDILWDVSGAVFLDCYAGSGAVGIEALSRGAAFTVFVEKDIKIVEIIKENLSKSKLGEKAIIINKSFESSFTEIKSHRDRFDLIFVDPPYGKESYERILESLVEHGLLAREGILIVEHLKKRTLPDRVRTIERFKRKVYGQTELSFYKF